LRTESLTASGRNSEIRTIENFIGSARFALIPARLFSAKILTVDRMSTVRPLELIDEAD